MLDNILLQIAKSAIVSKVDSEYSFDRDKIVKEYPFLNENGAVFVTLKYDDDLRGCIGSIISHQKLYDDILHNAISAGFSDSRFNPLEIDEFSHLSLEVSLLSEPTILEYRDYDDLLNKVKPDIDGLILQHGRYRGTFLPQVWEQLKTPKLFLEHLSMKAGANPSIYREHPTIYRYGVEHIEEKFSKISLL